MPTRLLASASMLLALLASARPAGADPAEDAGTRFREGLQLFRDQDYPGARAAFEDAYRISPNYRVLANIGDCQVEEGRPADAIATYRRFLREAGPELDSAARGVIEEKIASLTRSVSELVVTGEPTGAEVRVDGTTIGALPMGAPVALTPGAHTIEVVADGFVSYRRDVQVRGGRELELSVTLRSDAPATVTPIAPRQDQPAAPPPRPRFEPSTPLGRGPLFWSGVGLTAALVVAGTVTGLLALSAQDEYEDPATSLARRRELYDSRDTLPLVTDILLDSAVVVGLATAALFIFAGSTDEPPHEVASAADRYRLRLLDGGLACDLGFSF